MPCSSGHLIITVEVKISTKYCRTLNGAHIEREGWLQKTRKWMYNILISIWTIDFSYRTLDVSNLSIHVFNSECAQPHHNQRELTICVIALSDSYVCSIFFVQFVVKIVPSQYN